ncbi:GAF domain-containing sensor histidine kinase [Pelotomaculum propionicicum]|uniref:histidine kinase n=1 Tax=Pelotomaculum propionicicum TaxID=258475 RepID=A0A4Y7RXI8_9FIRM|nr:ATP-binding protein [Pelotomaculum propionicicum]NLI12048.1 GAF domain-containing protein [Peptococcaceae bacterium]TEB13007.1 Sensor protein ZraS [Pelotomaculum propionicicum]
MVLYREAAAKTQKDLAEGDVRKIIEELTRQNNRMAIIQQIAKSINVEMTYEEIIDEVATPLRSVLSYDLLSFCLLEKGQLIIKASIPKEQEILGEGWVLHSNNSAPWKAIHDKRCFLRQDIWHDSHKYQEDEHLRMVNIKSAIMAPLLVNNEAIGALNFGSSKTYAYSENDFIFVQQLADQLAVCINNARLFGEVSRSKREWEETFKAVPDKLFLIDCSFNVLRYNKQENLLLDNDGRENKCYHLIACCGGDRQLCPAVEAFKTGVSAVREVTHPSTRVIFNISAYPAYNENSELCAMVVYVNDVTTKRRMESQLFQSAKLAAIGEMAAGVAHELNSPLTAIIGNAGLILRKTDCKDKHYRLLEDIKNCGQRSKRIIQNLLTFARQDSYSFGPVSLNDVVETSLYLISYQIEKNKIAIVKKTSSSIPVVMGNKLQLEQIIINFLLNARDALEGVSEGRIEICTGVIEDPETESPAVMIRVTDNGRGMDPGILSQIFNPFFTTKEKTKGTGLGLSVSLGIAQTHGGRIDVASEPGAGSTFSLILPV